MIPETQFDVAGGLARKTILLKGFILSFFFLVSYSHSLWCFVSDGKIIPAYCNYTMGIYFMGRDPNLYPEPELFNPERFSMENTTEITNPFAYVPFSAGPRNCIGQKFAMLEIKSMLSKVLSHFELLPCGPEPRIIAEIVLRSQNGVHLGLKCRN